MCNVLLYRDEDGNWIADVPSLPGCHSDGRTRDEAIENVKEAIEVYIEALEQDGLPVPEEQSLPVQSQMQDEAWGTVRFSDHECRRVLKKLEFNFVNHSTSSFHIFRRSTPFAQIVLRDVYGGRLTSGVLKLVSRAAGRTWEQLYETGRARREDWKTFPLPQQHILLEFERSFSEREMVGLSYGFFSKDMQDKWFIFLEDNTLYFHRSWTGNCLFTVQLTQRGRGTVVQEVKVSRDPDQYTNIDPLEDIALLEKLIQMLLLGVR